LKNYKISQRIHQSYHMVRKTIRGSQEKQRLLPP